MSERVPNIEHPFMGGSIEQRKATTFMGTNKETGEPEQVSLTDAIIVSHGKKSVTITGRMAIAIHDTYKDSSEFRAWCDKCL